MPSKIQALYNLEDKVTQMYEDHLGAEEYHPDYKKYRDIFRLLARSDMATERGMKRYFKDQAKRSKSFIDWEFYKKRVKKVHQASLDDYFKVVWKDEVLKMRVLLTKTLVDAIVAGGQMTENDTNIDIGWGAKGSPVLEYLKTHTLKLAGNVTQTTRKRIVKGLSISIDFGETTQQAAARIADIIDDKRRAAVIAHTESVRAFTEGRLEVGRRIGADRKQWDATLKACQICSPMDKKVVKIGDLFTGGDGEKYDSPPAHPNCRCLIKILMKGEKA